MSKLEDKTELVKKAYDGLFPDIELDREVLIKYYKSFTGYNATVKYNPKKLEFHLSHKWNDISDEITLGLIQNLLVKIFIKKNERNNYRTLNMELYDIFLKKIHTSIPKDNIDPILYESFIRINNEYFNGTIEDCNLRWGEKSFRKLGSYDYTRDLITMSSIFVQYLPEKSYLLDYVMYHEMLHKKIKFDHTKNKKRYHTTEFRNLEKKFRNSEKCEKELSIIASKRKLTSKFLELFGF